MLGGAYAKQVSWLLLVPMKLFIEGESRPRKRFKSLFFNFRMYIIPTFSASFQLPAELEDNQRATKDMKK